MLTNPNGVEGHALNREGRLQELQQAAMEILTNLAEADNLPWTVQIILLKIISTTGVQAGAIRLNDKEDYIFTDQEKMIGFDKNMSLDCSFDRKLVLSSISARGSILPCVFERELATSGSFFCPNIPQWYAINALSNPNGKQCCEKCKELGYKTAVMVPIKTVGETLGLIHLYDTREKALSLDDVAFLEKISRSLGYALQHLQDQEFIRRSEKQFRFLTENARDIVFRMQIYPEKKLVYVSPASTFISGYSPQEFYADEMLLKEIVHPFDYPEYQSVISSGMDFSKSITIRLMHKDGRVIWVELRCVPIYNRGKVEVIEGIARDITRRVRAEQELKSSYERLKTFSSMILKAQEEERIRISRELHDEVGQALTAVKLDLQVVKEKFKKEALGFQERLSESIWLIDTTLERVRKQAVSLRPPALDHMGLVAAVQNMAQGFSRRTGIEVEVIAGDRIARFSSEVETALFRCIQEALTNIARHSGAKKAAVKLKYSSGSISISVRDDGKGFEREALGVSPDRLGLVGMQERIKLLNGSFKIDSKPLWGTRITIVIPLE